MMTVGLVCMMLIISCLCFDLPSSARCGHGLPASPHSRDPLGQRRALVQVHDQALQGGVEGLGVNSVHGFCVAVCCSTPKRNGPIKKFTSTMLPSSVQFLMASQFTPTIHWLNVSVSSIV